VIDNAKNGALVEIRGVVESNFGTRAFSIRETPEEFAKI
jgi:hypothetical protein